MQREITSNQHLTRQQQQITMGMQINVHQKASLSPRKLIVAISTAQINGTEIRRACNLPLQIQLLVRGRWGGGGGGYVLRLIFAGYVPRASQNLFIILVYFRNPNLVTFCLLFSYLIKPFKVIPWDPILVTLIKMQPHNSQTS